MKRFMAFCGLLFSLTNINAQEYRLNYDSSTLPELYNITIVSLEQKAGDTYQKVKKGYLLSTTEATLSKKNNLIYDPAKLPASGAINVTALIDGREVPLVLNVPVLKDIRFNLYADSIKPILNYYVNVEGEFTSGKIYPLSAENITITSDHGTMQGNEWIAPKERNFEKVTFTASSRSNPALTRSVTVYLKKFNDPRDAEGYEDPNSADLKRK